MLDVRGREVLAVLEVRACESLLLLPPEAWECSVRVVEACESLVSAVEVRGCSITCSPGKAGYLCRECTGSGLVMTDSISEALRMVTSYYSNTALRIRTFADAGCEKL